MRARACVRAFLWECGCACVWLCVCMRMFVSLCLDKRECVMRIFDEGMWMVRYRRPVNQFNIRFGVCKAIGWFDLKWFLSVCVKSIVGSASTGSACASHAWGPGIDIQTTCLWSTSWYYDITRRLRTSQMCTSQYQLWNRRHWVSLFWFLTRSIIACSNLHPHFEVPSTRLPIHPEAFLFAVKQTRKLNACCIIRGHTKSTNTPTSLHSLPL